jgi:hypothetical protein
MMMKKNGLLFFLVIAITTGVFAQDAPATKAGQILEKSLLWEVTGKGLETPSYVYGTIHMIDKKDFFLTEPTKAAMDKSDHFAFEIDLEEMSDIGKMMPLMMKAFMRGDTTLSDLLTDEEYQMVNKHFQKIGLPMMFVERIKPMFLSAMSGGDMLSPPGTETGPTGMVSYEFEIMKVAKEDQKPISGLETAAFQMSMFDSIPYSAQAQMLVESIQSEKDTAAVSQMDVMVKMYKDQDIEAMVAMMDEEGGIGGFEDLLLVNRNKKWIPIMEVMMKEKVTFFAVGAGHLGGEYGVIRLLKKAGYNVKPLY